MYQEEIRGRQSCDLTVVHPDAFLGRLNAHRFLRPDMRPLDCVHLGTRGFLVAETTW